MLHYIHHEGKELPVDFNVWTLVRLAKAYNTDLSGLQEVFAKFDNEEDRIRFVGNLGAIALTEGSRREGGGVRFTPDDIFDMLTIDMTLAQQLIDMLFATMDGPEVFPMAATTTAPPKRKTKVRG
jgi:hypothetical protein